MRKLSRADHFFFFVDTKRMQYFLSILFSVIIIITKILEHFFSRTSKLLISFRGGPDEVDAERNAKFDLLAAFHSLVLILRSGSPWKIHTVEREPYLSTQAEVSGKIKIHPKLPFLMANTISTRDLHAGLHGFVSRLSEERTNEV